MAITSDIEAREVLNAADSMRTEAGRLGDRKTHAEKLVDDHRDVLTKEQRSCIDDVLANLEQAIEILGQLAGEQETDFAKYRQRCEEGSEIEDAHNANHPYAA